jgi:RNA polymerase sigma-70 factor (ECF subfamily)
MPQPESTCWTVIEGAAAGRVADREHFAQRYGPVVRAYLAARWRTSPGAEDLDDAVQEVFVECFKHGGVLERADRERAGGFRPFLYGVVRNIALRLETDRARQRQKSGELDLDQLPADDESLARDFDRAWARSLLREAARRQAELAASTGEEAVRRVELLCLHFEDGLPIRDIARRWQTDAARLHHEYARARVEFKAALRDVMAFHHPGSAAEVEQACAELLALLGT